MAQTLDALRRDLRRDIMRRTDDRLQTANARRVRREGACFLVVVTAGGNRKRRREPEVSNLRARIERSHVWSSQTRALARRTFSTADSLPSDSKRFSGFRSLRRVSGSVKPAKHKGRAMRCAARLPVAHAVAMAVPNTREQLPKVSSCSILRRAAPRLRGFEPFAIVTTEQQAGREIAHLYPVEKLGAGHELEHEK